MGTYLGGRSRSAEDQIWEHLDRMSNAGPVADSYLAAHEHRAWAIGTRQSAPTGLDMRELTATVCYRRIGTHLSAVARWLAGTSSRQTVDGERFMPIQRRMAS